MPGFLTMALGCICLPVCLLVGSARAEAEPPPAPPPPPTRGPFDSAVLGAIVDSGIGTSMAGDSLMFELGGEFAAVRSLRDERWLLQWDALLAARSGYLANQHPYLSLIGAHELAWAEGGYRFSASRRWSPYLGTRLGSDARIMVHPGLALSALDTINDADGVAGAGAAGTVRVPFGASFLDRDRSLLLVAFVQEALQAAEVNTPARAFTQIGLGARFDIAGSIAASIEGAWGATPIRRDPLRGLTDRTTRSGGAAAFRKMFGNGMWISASVTLQRDSDHVVYFGGPTYDTANAPVFGLMLLYGLSLDGCWRSKS